MKIEILNKTDSEARFLIEGVAPGFVNELRRIMLSEIPTMAIEWVDFKKNDSALNDEVVANRLGQIPLTFKEGNYNLPEECKCEGKGCSQCQVKLTLKKKGPCMVYSGDLKSTDKTVQPFFDKIPIVELFEDQELEFIAIAQLGLGKTHAKWQGAVVGYKNKPKITIERGCEVKSEYIKSCPRNVFGVEGNKLIAARPLDCILCTQCVEATNGKIKVEIIEDSFIFNVESACGLNVETVIEKAAKVLKKKSSEFNRQLKKLK
jgi:DNA-directed RNA polymerase subunit D